MMKKIELFTLNGRQRLISTFLILLLCLQYPMNVLAADISISNLGETYVSGFYCYTIKDDGTVDLSFNESNPTQASVVNVPSTIDGFTVTSFRGCFFSEDNLETINFPSTIKEVYGIYCYSGRSLKNINVAENNPYLKSVNGILYSKDMTKLIAYPNGRDSIDYSISEGIKVLGQYALWGCSFNSLTLPESLEYISSRSICYPKNGKLTIPKNVKIIEDWAIFGDGSVEITVLNPLVKIGTAALGYTQSGSIKQIVYGYEGSSAEQYVRDCSEKFSESINCSFVKLKYTTKKTVNKKKNSVKVIAKTKTLNAKKLKSNKQTVKTITITKAKGKVKITLVKNGTTNSIRKKVAVNKKGAITFKKGKYKKGIYKIKVKITATGNSKYCSKTVAKTIRIRIN